jgi:uncharacterized protein
VEPALPILSPAPGDFAFACNRCGRCCTNGTGNVWIEAGEVAGLAAALGATPEAFLRLHVREIDGRLTLLERDGRCSLLSGTNECSVYESRPTQCRSFPFWPSVLEGGEALERAREVCPGIHEVPRRAAREAAYAELRALYAAVDERIERSGAVCWMRGDCCDFARAGHRLFATLLEVDFVAEHGPALGPPERAGGCEMERGGRCRARAVRPLACRTYFCDPSSREPLAELHEEALASVRELERRHRYPAGYGDFVELLPIRRDAIRLLDRRREEAG